MGRTYAENFCFKKSPIIDPIKFLLLIFITLLIHPQVVPAYDWLKETRGSYDAASPYVPKDLEDAHKALEKILTPEDLNKIKENSEDYMVKYHFGLGMWLRNNWGLWKGSRLSQYFNDLGIQHPDDMSGIILRTLWCKLHNQPFRLQERVLYYQAFWKAQIPPTEGNPKTGEKIDWLSKQFPKPFLEIYRSQSPKGFDGTLHLGVSRSDHSFWRYEFGSGRGIEPAREEEAKALQRILNREKLEKRIKEREQSK